MSNQLQRHEEIQQELLCFGYGRIQLVKELHKPIRRNYPRRRTIIKGLDDLWQMDLAEMRPARHNRGFKMILVVINCFSKFVWTRPLKTKTAEEITRAFSSIIRGGRMAKNLQSDQETEFYNTKFKTLIYLKIAGPRKLNVGDIVRISKAKHAFEKCYTPNFTTELFKITKVKITNPVSYLIEDMNGSPIRGCFYEEELQKTKNPNIYLVEKVLKRNRSRIYVKWLGLDKKHNGWIYTDDLV
ncbi:uncharacterized protein LOC130450641 [Diorhabda sublineata]|uniref:uncharacterized protein LOC130450641 n=1 Tax=Diorhabda sublineata TaxID=1163346 RepID=UPI0024E0CF50|nr:uncharacterized protein LOC130450641 [Diorhabda sublineata]